MQEKPKSNSVCTSTWDGTRRELSVTVLGVGTKKIVWGNLSEEVRFEAAIRGMNQRVVNAAALSRDKTTGKSATPQEKAAAVWALIEHYNSGATEWSPARQASGPKPLDPILLAAVGEVTGKGEDVVRALVAKGAETHKITGHQYLAKLGSSPAVAKVADRLRAAKVTVEIDIDAEIEGMIGEGEE